MPERYLPQRLSRLELSGYTLAIEVTEVRTRLYGLADLGVRLILGPHGDL